MKPRTQATRPTRETILALLCFYNKKPREIAVILSISTQAVYKHMAAAKANAARALSGRR